MEAIDENMRWIGKSRSDAEVGSGSIKPLLMVD
jgi:hypothetical protein